MQMGRGVRRKIPDREILWKSRGFTGVKFGEPVEKYVIICDFTGVGRCIWYVGCQMSSTSETVGALPRIKILGGLVFYGDNNVDAVTDRKAFKSRQIYLLVVHAVYIPTIQYMSGCAIIYSRKICIVRHWKYGQKTTKHPSCLCLVFAAWLPICRICPLLCVLLRFCLYFYIYTRLLIFWPS